MARAIPQNPTHISEFRKPHTTKMLTRRIPRENYLAAAAYVRAFFNELSIHWAAMGGLAMLCLGSRRPMSDIHIVYDTREFSKLKVKLQSDRR